MIRVDLLKSEHRSGNQVLPFFVGFLDASRLSSIAEAPQFDLDTPHETIAKNISTTPVREWQRPIDDSRVDEIRRIFSESGEIMPNAVLLAAHDPDLIRLTGTGVGSYWQLEVADDLPSKPLWILDGQHRIAGLSAASRSTPLPFVLLASSGGSANYAESMFAKIFAQVTTTAEGLHKLHNEWLTFAFKLGKYDSGHPLSGMANAKHVKAMAAATALCSTQFLDIEQSVASPFFNRVAFNPKSVKQNAPSPLVGPTRGGFQSDAVLMEDLFFRSYYDAPLGPGSGALLEPVPLSRELGRAYEALVECHSPAARASSVLLNEAGIAGAPGHKPLQDGFLHGVMRHIANNGAPTDWLEQLRRRGFADTNWDSSRWTSLRTGETGTLNKKVARSVFDRLLGGRFSDLFITNPPASIDLRDYFMGTDGWGFEIQACRQNPNGRKLPFSAGRDPSVDVLVGHPLVTFSIDDYRYLALNTTRISPNIHSVVVVDKARPTDKRWTWAGLRSGMVLEPDVLHSNPLELLIDITFYGGSRRQLEFRIEHI